MRNGGNLNLSLRGLYSCDHLHEKQLGKAKESEIIWLLYG